MEHFDLLKDLGEAQDRLDDLERKLDIARNLRLSLISQCNLAGIPDLIIGEVIGLSKQRVGQLRQQWDAAEYRRLQSSKLKQP